MRKNLEWSNGWSLEEIGLAFWKGTYGRGEPDLQREAALQAHGGPE